MTQTSETNSTTISLLKHLNGDPLGTTTTLVDLSTILEALVATEPKQGNLVLRQSGVLDVRQECGRAPERIWPPDPGGSVSQMRAGDFRSRSVAGRTRCVPPRGISPMSGVPGPSYGMHALDEAGCSP